MNSWLPLLLNPTSSLTGWPAGRSNQQQNKSLKHKAQIPLGSKWHTTRYLANAFWLRNICLCATSLVMLRLPWQNELYNYVSSWYDTTTGQVVLHWSKWNLGLKLSYKHSNPTQILTAHDDYLSFYKGYAKDRRGSNHQTLCLQFYIYSDVSPRPCPVNGRFGLGLRYQGLGLQG